jgi:hypothetical protein
MPRRAPYVLAALFGVGFGAIAACGGSSEDASPSKITVTGIATTTWTGVPDAPSRGGGGPSPAGGAGGVVATGGAGGAIATGGAGGVIASGGAGGVIASGGAGGFTGSAGAGGVIASGGAGGALASGGAGGALADAGADAGITAMPDFHLVDDNPASPSAGATISPRDFLGGVSAWYFGHST